MIKLTPVAALAICWLIGIIVGEPGIWFPVCVVAMLVVAIVQKPSGLTLP